MMPSGWVHLGEVSFFTWTKTLHLAALRQTPSLFALFLVTISCAGQESNVLGSTGFPPVLTCGPYRFA